MAWLREAGLKRYETVVLDMYEVGKDGKRVQVYVLERLALADRVVSGVSIYHWTERDGRWRLLKKEVESIREK